MKEEMIKNNIKNSSFKNEMSEIIDNDTISALSKVSNISIKDKIIFAITHPVALFTWKFVLTIFMIIIGSLVSIKLYTYQPSELINPISYENFSDAETFKKLQETHKDYLNLSKKQRLIRWVIKFSDAKYKLDGNQKYKEYDCIGAVSYYLWSFGSNAQHEQVSKVAIRLKNLVNNGSCKERKKLSDVKEGDLIVIQTEKNRPSHIGIVYGIMNNQLQIMDVSAKTMGMDIYTKKFNDDMIYGIYEMSFSFWIGDFLKEI